MKKQYKNHNFREEALILIDKANDIIDQYEAAGYVLTLRQLYYQFVSRDILSNTEKSYKRLGDLVSDARLAGLISWDAIEDRTRFARSNSHWDGADSILRSAANSFQLDKWQEQERYVEVWIEKDALVGVIEKVCNIYDVTYLSCRGYVSLSEMWAASNRFSGSDGLIIHLGDHDPSGLDMTRDIEERLAMFGEDVEVRRIALTMEQIDQYKPPPNPAKVTDSRFSKYRDQYGDESWELDALDPKVLSDLVRDEIFSVMDVPLFNEMIEEENKIKREIMEIADDFRDRKR